jgi:glucokinase
MTEKYVIAADLGGTKLAVALVTRSGKILQCESVQVDCTSALSPVKQLTALARESMNRKAVKGNVAAIGVAVPGLVRPNGTVWAPNLEGWSKMPLTRHLKAALKLPVVVESDRNAAILGETWQGAAKGKRDAIVLMLGTGIGAGILSGGHLVRGAHELSGCAGWMVVSDDVQNLESLAAGPAIARAAKAALARGISSLLEEIPPAAINAYEVAEAARRGDMVSIEVFLEAGHVLGLAVANLISLFDPEIIVIGGGLAAASDLFLDALRKSTIEHAQPIAAKQVRVVVSRLGPNANLLGAAHLAWTATRRRSTRH